MWYNQFRPALRRPAQPEFALYHIFQKKSRKIFSSNCTIFFPEISFFCAQAKAVETKENKMTMKNFLDIFNPGFTILVYDKKTDCVNKATHIDLE